MFLCRFYFYCSKRSQTRILYQPLLPRDPRPYSSHIMNRHEDTLSTARRGTCHVKTRDLKNDHKPPRKLLYIYTSWRFLIAFKISCFYIAQASSLYAINRDEVTLSSQQPLHQFVGDNRNFLNIQAATCLEFSFHNPFL